MRTRGSRQAALSVLAVVVVVLAWLVVRAAQVPTAPQPSAGGVPTTASTGPAASRGSASDGGRTDPASGLPWVAESVLPPEARHTLALIRVGGPFPYPRSDNQTFANRERLLPAEPRGYYREFTVVTPGSADRGARRIITGGGGEKYWTADHYGSFSRIREGT